VRADEKLTAFVELEAAIRASGQFTHRESQKKRSAALDCT
jgi:hypothetical protein